MPGLLGTVARSAIIGGLVGFPVLGVGSRILMRVFAHWEGRVPAFTLRGTLTVVFLGVMAGVAGGVVHGLARRFIHNIFTRHILFAIVCTAITWRAANVVLPRQRLMFVALTFAYIILMELATARHAARESFAPEPANRT